MLGFLGYLLLLGVPAFKGSAFSRVGRLNPETRNPQPDLGPKTLTLNRKP